MFTIATLVTAVIAFAVTGLLGFVLIPWLHKLKFNQPIKEIGPVWHQKKAGTPTMGGLLFIAGITLAIAVGWFLIPAEGRSELPNAIAAARVFGGLGLALCMGFMGFVDDYIKVVKKHNLGLRARDKIFVQVLGTAAYLATLYLAGDRATSVWFPFIGSVDFSWFYYPFSAFMIIGFINAVNLADGIDGLCGSVTFLYGTSFVVISAMLRVTEMTVPAIALAAGCLGYLIWNFHPAKVWMGDTGSMYLGGLVVALAFGCGMPMLLLLCGIVYFGEAMSDIIQVASFKTTGKRVFKMAPIHHHFEMCGFSENKIVALFSFVTAIGCAVGAIAVALL